MTDRNKLNTGGPVVGYEIELKLAGEPESLARLFASSTLRARATGRSTTKRLENIYYDTPDQRLRERGLAFRVRKDGRRYYQTLKSNDLAGLVAYRGEWQTPLDSPEPNLALMPPGAIDALGEVADPDELCSQFTTRVRRQICKVRTTDGDGDAGNPDSAGPTGMIEVAFDVGEIETARGVEPIAELELELLEGPTEALYDLALELDALAPLRLETRSKSARGYALAGGLAPTWRKAEPLDLTPETTVDDAIRAILWTCVQHWCANEAAAYEGGDPEGVHQMRVGLRRLRSAFSVFRHLVDPQDLAWLAVDAKQIINSQGPARDWDVFLAELLAPIIDARPEDQTLVGLRAAAKVAQGAGYVAVRTEIDAPAYTHYLLRLRRWIEARGWRRQPTEAGRVWLDRPIVDFADTLLTKRHHKARKLGRHFAKLSAERRHEVRIGLKKLRYVTEFFHALYPHRDTKPFLVTLKQLQDALGHLNDVAVAEKLVGELIAGARSLAEKDSLQMAGGLVLGWHARGVADLEPRTVKAWHDFADIEPFWHDPKE